ncbi:hypothetical protein [Streptomyces uncialis]|uniref:hypothetical protein n=1 Tax=Streptomyces uncialis TaxID=1048205 RepID=UPI0033C5E079
MTARPHGYARYKLDGCRCYTCGYAVSQYRENRIHAIRRGAWQPFVDAEPARLHVLNLRDCDLGARRIAELAGVERNTVTVLLNGRSNRGTPPPTHIRPTTAAALLSVEPTLDNLGSGTVIHGTGTTRRLQALVALGWPQCLLAQKIGMTGGNFARVITSPRVTVRTARAARQVYDTCWQAVPTAHGATQRGTDQARRRAASLRWAPVMAWDDDTIDDPDAYPDWTGACGTSQGYGAHYSQKLLPACRPCRDARTARNRELQAAQKAKGNAAGGGATAA